MAVSTARPAPALPEGAAEALPAARVKGARKAAVLLAALGPERAANVLSRLHEDEVERVSMEMARLDRVGPETTDFVLGEIAAGSGMGGTAGGVEFAREVIERA